MIDVISEGGGEILCHHAINLLKFSMPCFQYVYRYRFLDISYDVVLNELWKICKIHTYVFLNEA